MMPWWFWLFPGAILLIVAGLPLWSWLLTRKDRK